MHAESRRDEARRSQDVTTTTTLTCRREARRVKTWRGTQKSRRDDNDDTNLSTRGTQSQDVSTTTTELVDARHAESRRDEARRSQDVSTTTTELVDARHAESRRDEARRSQDVTTTTTLTCRREARRVKTCRQRRQNSSTRGTQSQDVTRHAEVKTCRQRRQNSSTRGTQKSRRDDNDDSSDVSNNSTHQSILPIPTIYPYSTQTAVNIYIIPLYWILNVPQTPLLGMKNGQNLTSWRWSLPLRKNPLWWGSIHAILSYRSNRPTHTYKPTNRTNYTTLQRI